MVSQPSYQLHPELGFVQENVSKKNVDDKTPGMLLKELGSLKMESKDKMKHFNKRFLHILNNSAANTKPHDSITVDYYKSALPTSIVQFVKRVVKPMLLENCEEALIVENDMRMIGFIKDDEPIKDSKDVSRNPLVVANIGIDKEASDIEILTPLVKALKTEVSELKQQMVETSASIQSPRQQKRSISSSNINFQAKTAQSSSSVFDAGASNLGQSFTRGVGL